MFADSAENIFERFQSSSQFSPREKSRDKPRWRTIRKEVNWSQDLVVLLEQMLKELSSF